MPVRGCFWLKELKGMVIIASDPQLPDIKWLFSPAPQNPGRTPPIFFPAPQIPGRPWEGSFQGSWRDGDISQFNFKCSSYYLCRARSAVGRAPDSFDTRFGHILSFLLPLIQEEQLSVTGESMCTKYWLNASEV